MEIGHGVDEGEGDPAPHLRVRLHAGGYGRAHHLAVPSLHDEEVRAEHAGVVAEDVGARSTIELTPEPGEHLELASHVVCARGDLAHGGPPQKNLVGPRRIRYVRFAEPLGNWRTSMGSDTSSRISASRGRSQASSAPRSSSSPRRTGAVSGASGT